MINTTSNLYFYKPAYNDDIIIFLNYQKLRLTRLSFLSQKKKRLSFHTRNHVIIALFFQPNSRALDVSLIHTSPHNQHAKNIYLFINKMLQMDM